MAPDGNGRARLARTQGRFYTPEALAARITEIRGGELEPAHVEALEADRARASSRIAKIAVACDVRAEWLMMNEGPMLAGGADSELDYREAPLTEAEWELIALWRQQPLETRPALLTLMEQLA